MKCGRMPIVIGLALCGTWAATAQTVPGFTVTDYASVTGPVELTFAPDGVLFSGTDLRPGGSGLPTYIHRIGAGGTPVTQYGLSEISDPDAVLYDGLGTVSGVPGSVLVAGNLAGTQSGQMFAIWPDQQVVPIFAPTPDMDNPNHLAFDAAGRAIIADEDGTVWACSGGDPTLLFTGPSRVGGMDVTPFGDLIYTASADGVIRIYDTAGNLVNDSFATGIGTGATAALEFGPGDSLWGNDLYAIDRQLGELLRIDSLGQATLLGTGFGSPTDMTGDLEFGPDGALYVSLMDDNCIIRIIPEPGALALSALALLVLRRR